MSTSADRTGSTSTHRTGSGSGQHRTVADLAAREGAVPPTAERNARMSRRWVETPRGDNDTGARSRNTGKQRTHVTELLRREDGDQAAAPPALAKPPRKPRSGAVVTSRIGVLFGLAVGGVIALQSTAAAPADHSPGTAGSNDVAAAAPHSERTANTSTSGSSTGDTGATSSEQDVALQNDESELDQSNGEGRAGGASPTSDAGSGSTATATRNAPQGGGPNADQSAQGPQQDQRGASSGEQRNSPDSGSADTTEQQSRSSRDDTGPAGTGADKTAQDHTAQQHDTSSDDTASDDDTAQHDTTQHDTARDDGTNEDNDDSSHSVLDPVTGAVSGVLDAGTSLLGG